MQDRLPSFASDWDGYAGATPMSTAMSTATMPQALSYYGYNTAAFGKRFATRLNNERVFGFRIIDKFLQLRSLVGQVAKL